MKKAVTLVELVMAVVIAGIVLVPTSVVIMESLRSTHLQEYYTVGASLLQSRLERITNLRFPNVVDESGNFPGNFSDYSYQVSFYYVSPPDLNTSVNPIITDYKRVTITVLRPGFPDLEAVTLITNN